MSVTLRELLMRMEPYELEDFAKETGIKLGTLKSIRYGYRNAGMECFNALHRYDHKQFTLKSVRPDLVWSE